MGIYPDPVPPCVELEGTRTSLAGARRAGPSPAQPSCGLPPHTNLQAHRHEPRAEGRCACQLRWGPGAGPWPPTVSGEGVQVSLAVTVKLKGHASERWGWCLCDLLGTFPFESVAAAAATATTAGGRHRVPAGMGNAAQGLGCSLLRLSLGEEQHLACGPPSQEPESPALPWGCQLVGDTFHRTQPGHLKTITSQCES